MQLSTNNDDEQTYIYVREQKRQARELRSIETTAAAIKYSFMGIVAASVALFLMMKVAPHSEANASSNGQHYTLSTASLTVHHTRTHTAASDALPISR
jgi:hypothetical protein